jgi:hypothetical protein
MPARAIHLEMAHYRASTKSLVDSACSRRKALLQDPRHMKREQGDPTTKLSVFELFGTCYAPCSCTDLRHPNIRPAAVFRRMYLYLKDREKRCEADLVMNSLQPTKVHELRN